MVSLKEGRRRAGYSPTAHRGTAGIGIDAAKPETHNVTKLDVVNEFSVAQFGKNAFCRASRDVRIMFRSRPVAR
jgi:hypothetical protein